MQLNPQQVDNRYLMIQRTDEKTQRQGQDQYNKKTDSVHALLPPPQTGVRDFLLQVAGAAPESGAGSASDFSS